MDTYLKSKFLMRLGEQCKKLKIKINSEKYWGFVEHMKTFFKVTGVDVELRQVEHPISKRYYYRLNLEIYFEKYPAVNYEMMKHVLKTYFYHPHEVQYGQDYLFITMDEIVPSNTLNHAVKGSSLSNNDFVH